MVKVSKEGRMRGPIQTLQQRLGG